MAGPLAILASRPRLTSAVGVGLMAGVLLMLFPGNLGLSTRAILAWDVGCLWLIVALLASMSGRDDDQIRRRAAAQDEGAGLILAVVTAAAGASLAAIALELSVAREAHGLMRGVHIALAFFTVAASWLVVQLIYALHYAHEFYGAAGAGKGVRGGLAFPGEETPDYWDFLHFAVVIGVASQTADIAFTSRTLRRIGTVHSVFSFLFNTVVLALTINLLAGLFQGAAP